VAIAFASNGRFFVVGVVLHVNTRGDDRCLHIAARLVAEVRPREVLFLRNGQTASIQSRLEPDERCRASGQSRVPAESDSRAVSRETEPSSFWNTTPASPRGASVCAHPSHSFWSDRTDWNCYDWTDRDCRRTTQAWPLFVCPRPMDIVSFHCICDYFRNPD
jgi:hypothetical protein